MRLVLQQTERFSAFSLAETDIDDHNYDRRVYSKYLSDQIVLATEGKQNFSLHSTVVLNVLEPHLEKCRNARHIALDRFEKLGLPSLLEHKKRLGMLATEEIISFDINKYPIRGAFCTTIFGEGKWILDEGNLKNLHKVR